MRRPFPKREPHRKDRHPQQVMVSPISLQPEESFGIIMATQPPLPTYLLDSTPGCPYCQVDGERLPSRRSISRLARTFLETISGRTTMSRLKRLAMISAFGLSVAGLFAFASTSDAGLFRHHGGSSGSSHGSSGSSYSSTGSSYSSTGSSHGSTGGILRRSFHHHRPSGSTGSSYGSTGSSYSSTGSSYSSNSSSGSSHGRTRVRRVRTRSHGSSHGSTGSSYGGSG